jgi:cell division protein FtsL
MSRYKSTTLYKGERRLFFIAASFLLLAFVAYVYFLSESVVYVVMRKQTDQEIATVNSHVSDLESQYIAAQHGISAELASKDGFVETDQKTFIDMARTSLVLSDNTES